LIFVSWQVILCQWPCWQRQNLIATEFFSMFLRNVLLAVGAVFVLAGVGLMIAWFGQLRNPPAVVGTPVVTSPPQQQPLVAARKIPRGTTLGEEDFKDAAPGEIHPGSLRRGEEKDFFGKPNNREIAEGEPLMPDDFNPCKLIVERGYRAVSISVDPAQSVAGLVKKDDYVDVLLTQTFDDKVTTDPRRKWAGETVLHDVQVLATDQSICPPSGVAATISTANTAARTPQTVTLALKERQPEVLMVAGKLGTFQLALVQHLESADTARPEENKAKPVWASDVSPALTEISPPSPRRVVYPALVGGPSPRQGVVSPALDGGGPPPPLPCPTATGSPLEQNVRCVPSSSVYYRAPEVPNSVAPNAIAPKPEPQQWPGSRYAPPN
jgi:pilus assembly protein CpaB